MSPKDVANEVLKRICVKYDALGSAFQGWTIQQLRSLVFRIRNKAFGDWDTVIMSPVMMHLIGIYLFIVFL